MSDEALVERARLAFADATALAKAYTDQVVFPAVVDVDHGPDFNYFPGWTGARVLVLCHENQGVVTWGLDLEPGGGEVIVGGDLQDGVGTQVYVGSVEEFARCRMWDLRCLDAEPLLQAQAEPLDARSLQRIRVSWAETTTTFGWPAHTNYRFERRDARLMIWSGADQADWWASGPPDDVASLLPELRELSNLNETLWSNDSQGMEILRRARL